jgi:hypothetical protein
VEEGAMIEQFWPGGEQPITKVPVIELDLGHQKLKIRTSDTGASIGYKVDDGHWQLYNGEVRVLVGSTLSAKAVRYGWKESEVRSIRIGTDSPGW